MGINLRLLTGPHTGFDEIELPAVQPGSSIMPGKINPAMAEMINMVCFHVIGHDLAMTFCAETGQLELKVMMPSVAHALLESMEVMANVAQAFELLGRRKPRSEPSLRGRALTSFCGKGPKPSRAKQGRRDDRATWLVQIRYPGADNQ